MKIIIIALPVPEDTDIFEVQDVVNVALTPTFNPGADEDDSVDSVVYESADALLDDLGIEREDRPW